MEFLKFLLFMVTLIGLIGWIWKGISFDRTDYGDIRGIASFPVSRTVTGLVVLVGILVFFSAIQIMPAGHRGVIYSQKSGVKSRILQEGFNVVTPAVETVHEVSVRVREHTVVLDVEKNSAASKDTQDVGAVVTVNYHYDAKNVHRIYRDIGDADTVAKTILVPKTQDAIKRATATFEAEDMIANRGKLAELIKTTLSDRLASSYLIVDDISVQNISFKKDFTAAIENKVKQKQLAKQAKLIVVTKEAEAEQLIAEATFSLESRILKAEGTAKANELLERSLTPGVLQQRAIDVWDGKFPTYYSGGAGAPLLFNIPK